MMNPIEVLYEDEYLVIINKPSGFLVYSDFKGNNNSLIVRLKGQFEKPLYPCHRLDRETSGIMVLAKDKKTQHAVMGEFKRKAVEKKYIAFVKGYLAHPAGEMKSFIRDYHQIKFAPRKEAKWAVTRYKVLQKKKDFSVVEVQPKTGRTNQIRIHFSGMGHPLLGERVYAFRKDFDLDFKRLALHACELTFRHPVTKKNIELSIPLPKDMETFLTQIPSKKGR